MMTDKEKLKSAHKTIKRLKATVKDLRLRNQMISVNRGGKKNDEVSAMVKQMAWNVRARESGF